jgi:hypothetical protein
MLEADLEVVYITSNRIIFDNEIKCPELFRLTDLPHVKQVIIGLKNESDAVLFKMYKE